MALQPADRFEWERIVRRCIMPKETKLVAYTLAQYGDAKGNQIRPGTARLAAVCGMGESTVRRHVEALRTTGLVERLSNGGGPMKKAARYRLTVPDDLPARVKLLDPEELSPLAMVSGDETSTPVDNPENSAHQASADVSPETTSEPPNSAHSGNELRSLGEVTPLTQVSAYQPNTPTKDQPKPDLPAQCHQHARCLLGENPGFLDAAHLNPTCPDCRRSAAS